MKIRYDLVRLDDPPAPPIWRVLLQDEAGYFCLSLSLDQLGEIWREVETEKTKFPGNAIEVRRGRDLAY